MSLSLFTLDVLLITKRSTSWAFQVVQMQKDLEREGIEKAVSEGICEEQCVYESWLGMVLLALLIRDILSHCGLPIYTFLSGACLRRGTTHFLENFQQHAHFVWPGLCRATTEFGGRFGDQGRNTFKVLVKV